MPMPMLPASSLFSLVYCILEGFLGGQESRLRVTYRSKYSVIYLGREGGSFEGDTCVRLEFQTPEVFEAGN